MSLITTRIMVALLACSFIVDSAQAAANQTTEKVFSTEQIRTDLNHLYTTLKVSHADLFANVAREEYDALFESTLKNLDAPASKLEAYKILQKFIAHGRIAHARIDFPSANYAAFRANGGKALPVYFARRDKRWVITENYSDSRLPAETPVVALNGQSLDVWFERLSAYISADSVNIAASLLEFQFPQYLWLELGEKSEYELIVREDNVDRTIIVPAISQTELQAAAEKRASNTVESSLREQKMLTDDIAYLKPGPFYNAESPDAVWDNTAFGDFINRSFDSFIASNADVLIVDLRDNPGGDNSFSDLMIAWFADRPFRFASHFRIRSSEAAAAANDARMAAGDSKNNKSFERLAQHYKRVAPGNNFDFTIEASKPRPEPRFTGQVIGLVDRHSYSNAVSVAAILQDYQFGLVAGEATADYATTYGAMETFTLPNTEFVVGFPKALIVRPSGDTKTGPLVPDVIIDKSALANKNHSEHEDPTLGALVSLIEKNLLPNLD